MRDKTQRPNNTHTDYDYDHALRMDEISENLAGTAGDNTFMYTFNPANQIKTLSVSNQTYAVDHSAQGRPGVYETNGLNQYTMANGGILDYDTDGNLTLDEQEDAVYEYSIENQLTKVIKDGTITELGYDATGKLLNIGDTYFLYDGAAVIAEYSQQDCYPCGRTMTKRYVHSVGIDDPIVQYNSSGTYSYLMTYLHKNHQGSVVAGSSYTGSLSYTNGYDSFGVPETTNQGRFAYTGQMYLEEIGLYYYKARIYNPKLGRFLQVDPIGYEDQMNLYAYVGNDPINMVDPTGESSVGITLPKAPSGRAFVYTKTSHKHVVKRHAMGNMLGSSPHQFKAKYAMSSYVTAATIASALVAKGDEYYQPKRMNSAFTFELKKPIGKNGESVVTLTTTSLSKLKDPKLIAEVQEMLAEAGIEDYNPEKIEVITTIAPDDGSMIDKDAQRKSF